MQYFIFAKPIADMFYAYSVIDYMLMAAALVLMFLSFRNIEYFISTDWLAIIYMALLAFTLFRNSGEGITHFIKMSSAFVLYFIGRGFSYQTKECCRSLIASQRIVLLCNVMLLITGGGYILWGSAVTFRGMYFYKTDFSMAMLFALITFAFLRNSSLKTAAVEWLLAAYLILISNTRMAMLIYFGLFALWMLYKREQTTGRLLHINVLMIGEVGVALIAGIFLIIYILSLPVFEQFHYINFHVSSISDIFGASNTQGRNVVWSNILYNWRQAPLLSRWFGVDFVTDHWKEFDSHNSYIKILYSTGIAGITVFIAFIFDILRKLNGVRDRSLFYFTLASMMIFVIQSMSQASIDFTQMTWIFMFFTGCSMSQAMQPDTVITYNDPVEMEYVRMIS